MNQVTLTGNLGKDAEEIVTAKSTFTSASLAWNNKGKDGEKITTWVNLRAFGKPGEWLAALKKGARVTVTGDLGVDRYVAKDGKEVQTLSVNVRQFVRVAFKDDTSMEEASTPVQGAVVTAKPPAPVDLNDPEIPF